jgi:integrase
MRRGEIFSLRWGDIDFKNKVVRILGSGTKNGKTRTTPLSSEAVEILGNWASKQMVPADFVFPGRSGARLNNIKSAWSALRAACGLNEFRFKDLRHHAASAMVEAGVPLIAVRDILGHASIETTAKFYAGVSEKIHRDAVETITKRLAG